MPIWIGQVEATAIAFGLQRIAVPQSQPLTHDLFCKVLREVDVHISCAIISGMEGGIFSSDLAFSNGKRLPARPSDSIALVIRTGSAILASKEVLDEVGVEISDLEDDSKRYSTVGQHAPLTSDQDRTSRSDVAKSIEGDEHSGPDTSAAQAVKPALAEKGTAVHDPHRAATRQMEVIGVRVETKTNQPILLLKEKQSERYLSIWIGSAEATAITCGLEGAALKLPLTHDLFCQMLSAVEVRLSRVTISSLTDGIFFSELTLSNGKKVEAGLSDSIALAVRTGTSIFAVESVLDEAGVTPT